MPDTAVDIRVRTSDRVRFESVFEVCYLMIDAFRPISRMHLPVFQLNAVGVVVWLLFHHFFEDF